jgi:hypothetical protein
MQYRAFRMLFILWMLSGTQINLQAQQLDSILNIAETKYMQEKVYLQTDKNSYSNGETVWFKAYMIADNLPGPLSKTLYAELMNEKGNILQRKTMPIILAGAASDFIIPDSLADSRLFIRAYTAWMLNFDSSLLCVKPINIIPKKITPKKQAAPVYGITFFPEGGDLIEGLSSQVAFKATDQDGVPVAVKGDIVSSNNKTLTSFTAAHDGMGTFALAPQPGETYKAIWKDKSGVKRETPLPVAKKDGIVLSISFPNNQLNYSITRPDITTPEFMRFTVVAQTQQRVMYSAQINLAKKAAVTAPIITDSMPDGVLQITVFNGLMEPVAERLVFVNNNAYSFITDMHMIEQNISRHGRNVLQLDVGGTLLTNLSVAVTDGDVNPVSKNESNIYTELLLSTDLKGSVYNPAYYFSEADSAKEYLDLVMMTNGWRRFKWEKILNNQWPAMTYQPDNYLALQGRVLGLSRTMLYNKQISGILKTKNNPPSFFNIPINEKGDFLTDGMFFFDTAKLYYQLSNDKDKSLTSAASFSFANTFIKGPVFNKELLSNLYQPDKTDSTALVKSNSLAALRRAQQLNAAKVQTLEEVKITTKQKSLKQKLDEEYTSGFFSGGDGYTFTTEDDPFAKSSQGVLQYLQGKVAGLQISTNGGGSATWRGSATSFFLNESPSDINMLQSINMNDVALIKVFRPPFFGASGGGAGGAIAIYTKKGASLNNDFKGLPFTNIYGYSAIREFYSPDYITNPDPLAKDYRTTLYWSPHVYIDKNSRRITLPFFNSDNCKKIRVIVEGINELGQLTREEKMFQ